MEQQTAQVAKSVHVEDDSARSAVLEFPSRPRRWTGDLRATQQMMNEAVRVGDMFIILLCSLASYEAYLADPVMRARTFLPYLAYGVVGALVARYAFSLARIYEFENLIRLRWQFGSVATIWSALLMIGITGAFLTKTSQVISRGWFLLWFASALSVITLSRVYVAGLASRWSKEGRL